ncbi:unnamed protein product [Aphanomyces euteiches]|uniref:Uncharacterized protein n=1 Tax=Aphanomyces euteiches TaxID=100861 RepID=A0A6G0WJQ1_9STRA|nr:hypothetical protein Ae201684_014542 [Aphanomyces euteiches]KAH9081186.1 hypothetical protein Ae201684P_012158 [Aphanomyces euteiches]
MTYHFSRRLSSDADQKTPKQALSNAESILRGLEAVGTGLQSLDGSLQNNVFYNMADVAEQIERALNPQTNAIERLMQQQADQMAQIMNMLQARESKDE